MKLKELVPAVESLSKLSKIDLPIKVSVEIARLLKKTNDESTIFHDKRKKILQKYGTQIKGGNFEINDTENYNKEINELLEIEVNIEFKKIKLDDLGDIKFSGLDLYYLNPFMEE